MIINPDFCNLREKIKSFNLDWITDDVFDSFKDELLRLFVRFNNIYLNGCVVGVVESQDLKIFLNVNNKLISLYLSKPQKGISCISSLNLNNILKIVKYGGQYTCFRFYTSFNQDEYTDVYCDNDDAITFFNKLMIDF